MSSQIFVSNVWLFLIIVDHLNPKQIFFEQKPIYLQRSLGSWGVFFVEMMQILKDYLNDKQAIFDLGDYKTFLIFF